MKNGSFTPCQVRLFASYIIPPASTPQTLNCRNYSQFTDEESLKEGVIAEKTACVLSCFSHVGFFATLWTAAHQDPLSVGFSRQKDWSGLPFPPPGDLPDPGIELESSAFPALQADSSPLSHQGSFTDNSDFSQVFSPSCCSVSQLCVQLFATPWTAAH